MKKKILSLILSLCLIIPCGLLTACEHKHTYSEEWTTNATHHWKAATCEHEEEKSDYGEHVYTDANDTTCNTCSYEREVVPSSQELSNKYKTVAIALWESIGIDNPLAQAQSLSLSFPEITTETNESHRIQNIKTNANASAGIIYMVSLLYLNDNFALTNGIAHFDASCTVLNQQYDYTFKLKPQLDIQNNKLILEVTSFVMGMTQYSYGEINFDFTTNQLKSYTFYSMIVEAGATVGMALTEDGKYMFNEPQDSTDPFAVAISECKDAFVTSSASIQKLTTTFNTEMQAYFDVLNQCIAELNGSQS